MTFLFGGRPGRQDPELAAAAQRRRAAFAKDIGDERGRAFAYQQPRGPRRWTPVVLIVLLLFAGLGLIPLLRGSAGGLLPRQCDQPTVGASAGVVRPGGEAAWQVAGPDSGQYVVTLDSGGVTGSGGAVSAGSGRILAGPFRLTGCRSAQTHFDAPTNPGRHEISLFRRAGGAGFIPVASTTLRVG